MSLWSFRNRYISAGIVLVGALLSVAPVSAGTVPIGAAVNYAFFAEPYINTFSFNGANKITGNVVTGADGQNTGALNAANAIPGTAYKDVVSSDATATSGIRNVPAEQTVLPVTLIDLSNGFLTLRGGVLERRCFSN